MKIHYFTLKGQADQIMSFFIRSKKLKIEKMELDKRAFKNFANKGYSRKILINLYFAFVDSVMKEFFIKNCDLSIAEFRRLTITKEYKVTQKMLTLFLITTAEFVILCYHKEIKNNLKF